MSMLTPDQARELLVELVIDGAAARVGKTRWDLFVTLDGLFEEVAAEGAHRLERSRV